MHHYNAEGLLEAAARSPHVEVEGIYSHFANADAEDLTDARRQLARFEEVLRFYERRSLPVPQRHMANSAALLRLPESHLDLVRPGILLYGVYPYAGAPRDGRGAARRCPGDPASSTSRWSRREIRSATGRPGRATTACGS